MKTIDAESQRLSTDAEKQHLLSDKESLAKGGAAGDEHENIWHDAVDTILLGVPIFASMISWVGMKTTDSALLGHVSADALAAAALSDLVRSLSDPRLTSIQLTQLGCSGPCVQFL